MANESAGNHEITTVPLFPWNRRDLTSLVDEKGRYLGMDDLTIETALDQADAHASRLNAQQSKTFSTEFDDPDEEDEDEEDVPVVDGEQPE